MPISPSGDRYHPIQVRQVRQVRQARPKSIPSAIFSASIPQCPPTPARHRRPPQSTSQVQIRLCAVTTTFRASADMNKDEQAACHCSLPPDKDTVRILAEPLLPLPYAFPFRLDGGDEFPRSLPSSDSKFGTAAAPPIPVQTRHYPGSLQVWTFQQWFRRLAFKDNLGRLPRPVLLEEDSAPPLTTMLRRAQRHDGWRSHGDGLEQPRLGLQRGRHPSRLPGYREPGVEPAQESPRR